MRRFPALPPKGLSLVEVIIVLNIIAIIVAILVPVYRSTKGRAAADACSANLHNVWMEAEKYSQREGDMPDYLGQLYPSYIQNASALRCPSDRRTGLSPESVGYGLDLLYTKRQRGEPGTVIMGGCPFHKKGLVLHLDGSITQADFQTATLRSATDAEWLPRDATTFTTATDGTTLQTGDTVRTGSSGQAIISFEEGTNVTLYNNSELTLKIAMKAEQSPKLSRVLFSEYIGTIVADVAHGPYIGGGGGFEIQTPSAVAAVRGTKFKVVVDAEGDTTVTVLKGIVDVFGGGRDVPVPAPQTITVNKVKHSTDAPGVQPVVTKGHGKGKGKGKGNGNGNGNGNDNGNGSSD